jgi:hypothetical protein
VTSPSPHTSHFSNHFEILFGFDFYTEIVKVTFKQAYILIVKWFKCHVLFE